MLEVLTRTRGKKKCLLFRRRVPKSSDNSGGHKGRAEIPEDRPVEERIIVTGGAISAEREDFGQV